MNIFKKLRALLRLYEAIRLADKAHEETGGRYYVMPAGGNTGKLIIMDRRNFRQLKIKRYINQDAKVSDLEKECFYCTPYRNGKGCLPGIVKKMKREEYFKWLGTVRGK